MLSGKQPCSERLSTPSSAKNSSAKSWSDDGPISILCDDGGFEPLADADPQSLAQLLRQDRQYRAVGTEFSLLERCLATLIPSYLLPYQSFLLAMLKSYSNRNLPFGRLFVDMILGGLCRDRELRVRN